MAAIQDNDRIGWCDLTWNSGMKGCNHGCGWKIGGQHITCYAERIALGLQAQGNAKYVDGFKPLSGDVDDEPLRIKEPKRIFVLSMGDLFGSWVKDDQIERVLDVCRRASWHTFILLTKHYTRLPHFIGRIPKNCIVGVSIPPTYMTNGSGERKELTPVSVNFMLAKSLEVLKTFKQAGYTTLLSAEPLWFDVASVLDVEALSWIIIGGGSRGKQEIHPHERDTRRLIQLCTGRVPIFVKSNAGWPAVIEQFPTVTVEPPVKPPKQLTMF
jgi:protein gp37